MRQVTRRDHDRKAVHVAKFDVHGGRGYDAKLFAALGLETWGIDISPVAVTAAKEWLASLPTDSPGEKVHFEALDFFNFEPPVGGFDVAYDYTFVRFLFISSGQTFDVLFAPRRFFCALPADLHKSWAETYAKLIKPSGYSSASSLSSEIDC